MSGTSVEGYSKNSMTATWSGATAIDRCVVILPAGYRAAPPWERERAAEISAALRGGE
ncbi:hypothetical protein AB0P19_09320 [Microbacterium oleivorans]|uniref:hypothetical protein n=1 Tax=Microbacterium oleivorans TaxID=273677 RepID=UPI0034271DB6